MVTAGDFEQHRVGTTLLCSDTTGSPRRTNIKAYRVYSQRDIEMLCWEWRAMPCTAYQTKATTVINYSPVGQHVCSTVSSPAWKEGWETAMCFPQAETDISYDRFNYRSSQNKTARTETHTHKARRAVPGKKNYRRTWRLVRGLNSLLVSIHGLRVWRAKAKVLEPNSHPISTFSRDV